MTKTVLYLRHSIKNNDGELSPEGFKLSERIARIVQGEFGQEEYGQKLTDKIIHSGSPRARQTAQTLAETLKISELLENAELITPFRKELEEIFAHPLFREGDTMALKQIDDELQTHFVKREGLRLKKVIENLASEIEDGETMMVVGHGNNSCLALVMGFKIPIVPIGDEMVDTISMKPLYGLKLRISANTIIGGEFFTPY